MGDDNKIKKELMETSNGEKQKAKYDPMTGEPVKEVKAKYDPMTEEPVKEVGAKYDPMTGEPVKEVGAKYDPMTGEPVKEVEAKYDPMTGEPVKEVGAKYDPMTGEPVKEVGAKYDPMTGEPVKEVGAKYDPMTGELINKKLKADKKNLFDLVRGKVKKIGFKQIFSKNSINCFLHSQKGKVTSIAVIVILVLVTTFEICASLPKNKVILSAINTAIDIKSEKSIDEKVLGLSTFVKSFNSAGTEQNLSLIDMDTELKINLAKNPKNNNSTLYASLLKDDEVIVDSYVYDSAEERIFGLPDIYDQLFIYNKNKDQEQYNKVINQLYKINIDYLNFDRNLEDGLGGLAIIGVMARSLKNVSGVVSNANIEFSLLDFYRQIEIQSIDNEKFSINDKVVKAKGYIVIIPREVINSFIDSIAKPINNNDSVVTTMESMGIDLDTESKKELRKNTDKFFENLKENSKDIKFNTYIYKNKIISCDCKVNLENSDIKVKLELLGHKNPLDKATLSVISEKDSESGLKIDTDTNYNKKSRELDKSFSITLIANNEEISISNKLEYDKLSGNLESKCVLDIPMGEMPIISLKGNINELKKGNALEMEIERLRLGNDDNDFIFDGYYSFSREKQKIIPEKGDINVNDLSNKEINSTVDKIKERLNKNMNKLDDENIFKYYYETYYNVFIFDNN